MKYPHSDGPQWKSYDDKHTDFRALDKRDDRGWKGYGDEKGDGRGLGGSKVPAKPKPKSPSGGAAAKVGKK